MGEARRRLGLRFPDEMWMRRYGHLANATPCTACGGAGQVDKGFVRAPSWIPFPPPVQMETCTLCRGEGSRRCDACGRRMADRYHLGRELFLCERCDHEERDPHEPCAMCSSTAEGYGWCIRCGARACSPGCARKHDEVCSERAAEPRPMERR